MGNLAGSSLEKHSHSSSAYLPCTLQSEPPLGFLTCRPKRWCVLQGQSGRMCRGAEGTRDGARAMCVPAGREAESPRPGDPPPAVSRSFVPGFVPHQGRKVPAPAAPSRLGILRERCERSPCPARYAGEAVNYRR